jgi:hypothetical protein
MKPVAASHQLRVFGAYTRRLRAGMKRVKVVSSDPHLLVTAFNGAGGEKTLILLNRSTLARKVQVKWQSAAFRYMETVSPRQENSAQASPQQHPGAALEVLVEPGAIVTLTNVGLGQVPADLELAKPV